MRLKKSCILPNKERDFEVSLSVSELASVLTGSSEDFSLPEVAVLFFLGGLFSVYAVRNTDDPL